MLVLSPDLILFDELDSGLDIDSFKKVCDVIIKHKKEQSSFMFVTHSTKFLEYFQISKVHLMSKGSIIKTGDKFFANDILNKGFTTFI